MNSGERDGYWWGESRTKSLSDILRVCPHIIIGKFVAVTACDSGPLFASDGVTPGWEMIGRIAFSPRIESVRQLPQGGFDEWYIFREPTRFEEVEVFVNYEKFTLRSRSAGDGGMQDRFWEQMGRVQPESFIADGLSLVVVTANPAVADCVKSVLISRRGCC